MTPPHKQKIGSVGPKGACLRMREIVIVRRLFLRFLADRTNGRAIGTVLRLSSVCLSVCLSVTLCIVAKRYVLEQKLLLRAYRKLYMTNRLVPK